MFQRYGSPAAYTYSTETKIPTDFLSLGWRFTIFQAIQELKKNTHTSIHHICQRRKCPPSWKWPKSPADQVFRQTPGDWEEGFGCKLLLGDGRNSSSFPRWSRLRIPAEEYPSLPWGPKYLPRSPWNSAQDDASKWTMAIGTLHIVTKHSSFNMFARKI